MFSSTTSPSLHITSVLPHIQRSAYRAANSDHQIYICKIHIYGVICQILIPLVKTCDETPPTRSFSDTPHKHITHLTKLRFLPRLLLISKDKLRLFPGPAERTLIARTANQLSRVQVTDNTVARSQTNLVLQVINASTSHYKGWRLLNLPHVHSVRIFKSNRAQR